MLLVLMDVELPTAYSNFPEKPECLPGCGGVMLLPKNEPY